LLVVVLVLFAVFLRVGLLVGGAVGLVGGAVGLVGVLLVVLLGLVGLLVGLVAGVMAGAGRRRGHCRRCRRSEVGGETCEVHLQRTPCVRIGHGHGGQRLSGSRDRDCQHVQDGGAATHRGLGRGVPHR